VVAVANELDVHLPASSRRDDTDIAETLSRTLAHSISLPMGTVKATVRKGAVTLEGTVTWSYQREAAERIARHAAGITDISNRITIKAATSAHDVEKDIRAALHRRANLDANGVHVAVQGNVGDQRNHGHPSSHSVFGEPVELDGALIITAARVRGAGGGGAGVSPTNNGHEPHTGCGGGASVVAEPVGAYVVQNGTVRRHPAVASTPSCVGLYWRGASSPLQASACKASGGVGLVAPSNARAEHLRRDGAAHGRPPVRIARESQGRT
jgi:hypothetical protein